MYSSLLQLAPGLRDLSQAEKRITAIKSCTNPKNSTQNCPG